MVASFSQLTQSAIDAAASFRDVVAQNVVHLAVGMAGKFHEALAGLKNISLSGSGGGIGDVALASAPTTGRTNGPGGGRGGG
jgi:hypothetical protein